MDALQLPLQGEGGAVVLNNLRRRIVQMAYEAGEGHIASALSILDLVWVLYDKVLRVDPQKPRWEERDRFVLSKGHGCLALYAVLAEKGFFPVDELEGFAQFDSRLGGHPDRNKVPGVEASTGSLGHGLPMSVGMALGLKIKEAHAKGQRGKGDGASRVVVLVGDGECNEGSIWEAALLAAHHELGNLTVIVDYNHSTDRALRMGNIAEKFRAFGWFDVSINGHDHKSIVAAMQWQPEHQPVVIVANTIKGNGVKEMENNPAWHHRAPNKEELTAILAELE